MSHTIPKRTRFYGYRAADPATPEDGGWWYNTTEDVFKWYIDGTVRRIAAKVAWTETDFVVPVGGGAIAGTITITGLTTIEELLSVTVRTADPPTEDVYTPQAFSISGNVVGISIGTAATGTTLSVRATAYGL